MYTDLFIIQAFGTSSMTYVKHRKAKELLP